MRPRQLAIPVRILSLSLALTFPAGCRHEAADVTSPTWGTIRISLTTTGADLDEDGYVVTLDGATKGVIGVSGTLTVSGVSEQVYTVALAGVAPNCAVQPPATRTVSVTRGGTSEVVFAVACAAFGHLPADQQIAFVRAGQIYLVNGDGTGLVQLTRTGRNDDPAWSPDGRRIAFESDRDAIGGDGRDIYVMDADGSHVVRRTSTGFDFEPAWSPDGRKIAFASSCESGGCIYVASADDDGTSPVRVGFERGVHEWPAWSPDGRKIAFVSDWMAYDIDYDVFVADADGSAISQLTQGLYYFQPAWSPDGRRIAVVGCAWALDNCYPTSTIAVMNADGSGLTTLATAGGFARPTWSPDGSTIAYASSACRDCPSSIYYVRADGSGRGIIVSNGHRPAWRP